MLTLFLILLGLGSTQTMPSPCEVEWIVLGAGQDAGAPQIGNPDDPAWETPDLRLFATSAALVDHTTNNRFLFEATPFITDQLALLDELAPSPLAGLGISGLFLTHAHMGHYGGLMFLGFEAANADSLEVYAMPRMANYLSTNGPWDQLVRLKNIRIAGIEALVPVQLSERIKVTAHPVPHRDEYSETVGFVIETPGRSVLFLPDLDSYSEWESEFGVRVEDLIAQVDHAFLDATFYDDNEIPGRDMSTIPHPRVAASMDRFDALPDSERRKIIFVHFNHTNPVRFRNSPQSRAVLARGYRLARRGDRICLAP